MIPHFHIDASVRCFDFPYSPAQDRNHAPVQPVDLLKLELVAAGLRVDTGRKKDFIGVGITDSAQGALVHQKDPYLAATAPHPLSEQPQRERGRKQIDALGIVARDTRGCSLLDHVDLAHPPGVEVVQVSAAVQLQREAVLPVSSLHRSVLADVLRIKAEKPGQHEVNDHFQR